MKIFRNIGIDFRTTTDPKHPGTTIFTQKPIYSRTMNYETVYDTSISDPISFWRKQAELIDWFSFPDTILSQDEDGLQRWYSGGKLNTSYLALDVHIKNGKGDQPALIYDSPVTDTKQVYSYSEVWTAVERVAGMLRHFGVDKGDRVVIYMPMVPETAFAMLACARIGAIHSVVFGGFAANELAIRIDDAQPALILTASGGIEVDRIIPYKPLVDAALEKARHPVENVVVLQRPFIEAQMQPGRDHDWSDLVAKVPPAGYVELDASDPLYIIYTSGTTGKPKGVVREHGGHAVAMYYSMKYIYGAEPADVFWAASDYGWAVGHSYIVYGPLIYGCTAVIFEGKPVRTPDAGTFWRILEEYQVKIFFTAPTAFRAIRKEDPEGALKKKYDTSCLKYLFVAGERCDVSTLNWLSDLLRVPVIDHWWQTESGWPMISQMTDLGLYPIKPGSAGKAVTGYEFKIVTTDGKECGPGEEGNLLIKYPLPPGALPNLWNDTDRFKSSYLGQFPGYYFSGDGAYRDEDGYFYITGRIDDVINVAGHRLSTAEMEEVIAAHPAVAECAVIGVRDALKGQVPIGLVVLKGNQNSDELELEKELIQMVRNEIGPVASFKKAMIVTALPKTRSGKILRNVLRSIADGKKYQAPSTIMDMSVLDDIQALFRSHGMGRIDE